MLNDFFKLDKPFNSFDEAQLEAHFKVSNDLRSVMYVPDNWIAKPKSYKGCQFTNVSFSKTKITKVTFTECTFTDCLFIGTEFEDTEFHRCHFQDCNFYKTAFDRCYIDPNSFNFNKRYRTTHANVGVQLFQQLYDDAARSRQSEFAMVADIQFRRWKRWQLDYDRKSRKIGRLEKWKRSFFSWMYEALTGFGYKPFRFVIATMLFFGAVSIANMFFLPQRIKIDGDVVNQINFADAIFYTFSMMTALGFSSIIPQTSAAKLFAVGQALAGIGWLGLFTSLLVKRFIK
jgi:hypothetical protein